MRFNYKKYRRLADEAGLGTDGSVAEGLGIDRGLFTRLRQGKQDTVSAPIGQKIADILGTSTDYLYDLVDDPGVMATRYSPELTRLIAEIAALSPPRREDLRTFIRVLHNMDESEEEFRELFMRMADNLIDESESSALATAFSLLRGGDRDSAQVVVDSVVARRNSQEPKYQPGD